MSLKTFRNFRLIFIAGAHSIKEKIEELAAWLSWELSSTGRDLEISWSNFFMVQMEKLLFREVLDLLKLKQRVGATTGTQVYWLHDILILA